MGKIPRQLPSLSTDHIFSFLSNKVPMSPPVHPSLSPRVAAVLASLLRKRNGGGERGIEGMQQMQLSFGAEALCRPDKETTKVESESCRCAYHRRLVGAGARSVHANGAKRGAHAENLEMEMVAPGGSVGKGGEGNRPSWLFPSSIVPLGRRFRRRAYDNGVAKISGEDHASCQAYGAPMADT